MLPNKSFSHIGVHHTPGALSLYQVVHAVPTLAI